MKALLLFSLFTSSVFAADFNCVYKSQLQEVHQNRITIQEGTKNQLIADFDVQSFYLSSLDNQVYELQSLDSVEPARTYAISRINSHNPELSLVVWKRESIIEVKCSLVE